jgi:hypothetical protein
LQDSVAFPHAAGHLTTLTRVVILSVAKDPAYGNWSKLRLERDSIIL